MRITIIAVGKVKEKYWLGAIEEYSRRLGRYCKLDMIQVQDEKTPDGAPLAVEKQIMDTEGERILKKLPDEAFAVALAIRGEMFSSEDLADFMEKKAVEGVSHLAFIIGGSLGLSQAVLRRADVQISFSRMTFPHQMMRVILLEQIYRGFRIIAGEPYHK